KALLLDQMLVAGVGNIYADETCFRARVRPDRPANELSRPAVGRLHAALGELLRAAIANRGSSVGDYRGAGGEVGSEVQRLRVGQAVAMLGGVEVTGLTAVGLAAFLWRRGFGPEAAALAVLPLSEALETVTKTLLPHAPPLRFEHPDGPSVVTMWHGGTLTLS